LLLRFLARNIASGFGWGQRRRQLPRIEEKLMTLCMAALCTDEDAGAVAVVAADRMVTYGGARLLDLASADVPAGIIAE
jgi:hypothetical protein